MAHRLPTAFPPRLVGLVLLLACVPPAEEPLTPAESDARARELLAEVARRLAAPDVAAPLVLHARGRLDKTAEGQGFEPGAPSAGALREVLGRGAGSVFWEYREDRFDGTFEWFREAYPTDSTRLYVVHELALALPAVGEALGVEGARLRRRFPDAFVEELGGAGTLRYLGRDGGVDRVAGTVAGVEMTLEVGAASRLPVGISYEADLPGRGPTTVRWWYDDYRELEDLGLVPHQFGTTVGGARYRDLALDSVTRDPSPWLASPDGYRVTQPSRLQGVPASAADGPSDERAPLRVDTLAPGLYRVPEVRSGFAPLVAEVGDGLAVVDAPASFPLLGSLPAGETDAGPSMSWASESLLDGLATAFPGRPVRHLVLTHHHEDHLGGVRAFVAAGATVHATPTVESVVRRLLELPSGSVSDRFDRTPSPLTFSPVVGAMLLGAGPGALELLPLEGNPHARGLLVVHAPAARLLYVSDLVTPAPEPRYPAASHAALDRWFAGWLVARGPDVDRIVAMHGAPEIEAGRVRALRPAG